jgi:hypothetical protein
MKTNWLEPYMHLDMVINFLISPDFLERMCLVRLYVFSKCTNVSEGITHLVSLDKLLEAGTTHCTSSINGCAIKCAVFEQLHCKVISRVPGGVTTFGCVCVSDSVWHFKGNLRAGGAGGKPLFSTFKSLWIPSHPSRFSPSHKLTLQKMWCICAP